MMHFLKEIFDCFHCHNDASQASSIATARVNMVQAAANISNNVVLPVYQSAANASALVVDLKLVVTGIVPDSITSTTAEIANRINNQGSARVAVTATIQVWVSLCN